MVFSGRAAPGSSDSGGSGGRQDAVQTPRLLRFFVCHTGERDGMARGQGVQVGHHTAVIEHLNEADKTTFRGLGLQNHGQPAAQLKGGAIGTGTEGPGGQGWMRRLLLSRSNSIHSLCAPWICGETRPRPFGAGAASSSTAPVSGNWHKKGPWRAFDGGWFWSG